MATWINGLTLALRVLLVLSLSACATHKEAMIPQDGPDMATIYATHQRHAGAVGDPAPQRQGLQRPVHRGSIDLRGYTREAVNEIDAVFPLLPNPRLVLFVFPHLSAEGAPVPGYSTAFPLYPIDQYALPGEVYRP